MKQVFFLFFTIFLTSNSIFSQETLDYPKPYKNHFGIGLDYRLSNTVSIPGLKFEYYLNESWSINLGYYPGIRNTHVKNIVDDGDITEVRNKYAMHLGLGIEKHFFPKLRVDPFVGLNVYYIMESLEELKRTENYNFANGSSQINKNISQLPSSNGIQTTVNLGINYFIIPSLNLGLQGNFGYAFSSSKMEIVNSQKITSYDPNGNITFNNKNELKNQINSRFQTFVYNVSIKTAFYFSLMKKAKK